MNRQDFDKLVNALLDGSLDEQGQARLRQLLTKSPEARKKYWRDVYFHLCIQAMYDRKVGLHEQICTRTFAELADALQPPSEIQLDDLVVLTEEEYENIARGRKRSHKPAETNVNADAMQAMPNKPHRPNLVLNFAGVRVYTGVERDKPAYGFRFRYLAYAAVFLLLVTLGVMHLWPGGEQEQIAEETPPQVAHVEPQPPAAEPETPDPRPEPRPIVATIGRTVTAQWDQPATLQPDTRLREGDRFTLTHGYMEVVMRRGARVVLEAPCIVHLIDDNRLRIDRGKLVANVPPAAKWFTVDTPTSQLVDLGTEFAVSVEEDGSSRMVVFHGEVNVIEGAPDQPRDFRATQRIRGGWGAVFNTDGDMDSVPAVDETDKTIEFARKLEDIERGVRVCSQVIYSDTPPASVVPFEITREDGILLFREREGYVLTQDLVVDSHGQDGIVFPDGDGQRQTTIPAGTRVDVYKLHYNRARRPAEDVMRATGTVRFEKPILGMIYTADRLVRTSPLLGHPQVRYTDDPDRLGLQLLEDRVALTHDGTRVHVNWAVSTGVDQLRVIVRAED